MFGQNADGTYVHRGRSDDMLKVSGSSGCLLCELENCLLQHDSVRGGGCRCQERRRAGQTMRFRGRRERVADTRGELQAFAKTRLEPYKYPRR